MGVVFEAHDRELETRVALKTLNRVDARSLRRFKREFRMLQGIEHANLVSLGELFEHEGRWFFSMELVSGVDLLSYVRGSRAAKPESTPVSAHAKTAPIARNVELARDAESEVANAAYDEARLRACAGQLARATHALHECGVIHRDIKPSNVMVTEDGHVVLLDFGVALAQRATDSSTHAEAVGTVAYMAPEQAVSGDVASPADWYAFGVMLYEALTGHLPYSGATSFELLLNKQSYAPPPPRTFDASVPADLNDLCVDLLSVAPSDRPTGKQILERLGVRASDERIGQPITLTTNVGTQTGPFVGRNQELSALHAAFSETRAGHAQTVLVQGESGIGKSSLIREFTERLTGDDPSVVVLTGRCYERESVPFKAFDGVIDSLARFLRRIPDNDARAMVPRYAALLPRVFPALGRVEAIAEANTSWRANDAPELRRRAFAALRELLHLITERYPLVLVVDDLQWSDMDSRLLMEDLLQPPDPPPLLLVASARYSSDDEAPHGSLLLASWHTRIELEPLQPEAAMKLARLLLVRAHLSDVSPEHIATEASGHPLYMDELVRHTSIAEDSDHSLRLDDAIRARVAALPADARRVLTVAAVAGTPVRRGDLAEATRLDMAVFDKQVSVLKIGNLVRTTGRRAADTVEPYHDRVREAVVAAVDDETRRTAHQRLAFVLEGAPGAPAQLVLRHLEAAGQTEKASGFAETAAQQAARGFAFDRAADLYAAAIRLGTHDPEHRRELELLQAEALVNAGRGLEAADLFLAVARDADPARRLACRRMAAEQLITTGHVDRGLSVLDELLGEIGAPRPTSPRRALASVLWHRGLLRLRGLSFKQRHLTELAEHELVRIDVMRAAGIGLAMIDPLHGAGFNARLLRMALAAGELTRLVPALAMEASYKASQGGRGIARARKILASVTAVARTSDDPYLDAWVTSIDGLVEYFAGSFGRANEIMSAAVARFRDLPGATWELNNAQIFNLFAMRQGGRLQRFRDAYAVSVRDARRRGDRYVETTARRYGNFLWLADDDPDGALAELDRASWTPPEGRFHLQHWYDLEAQSEVALYQHKAAEVLGERAELFEQVAGALQMRVQAIRARVYWLRGRLLLAASQRGDATGSHQEVARLCRRLDRERTSYVNVYAALLRAGAAHQRGDDREAVSQLRRAVSEAEPEMLLHANSARRQLGSILEGDAGAQLVRQADEWMRAEGVRSPARFAHVVVPGFDD